MAVEQGFAVEEHQDVEIATKRSLEEILRIPKSEVFSFSREELEHLESDILERFSEAGQSVKSFADFTSGLRPGQLRDLKKPEVYQKFLAEYIDVQLLTARQTRQIKQVEGEKVAKVEGQAADTFFNQIGSVDAFAGVDKKTKTYTVLRGAEEQARAQYRQWVEDRQPYDKQGQPTTFSEKHQRLIQRVEDATALESSRGDGFLELTSRLEATFARGIDEFEVFGSLLERVEPASRFDDISNHVDILATLNVPDKEIQNSKLVLGIDFTMTIQEDQQAKKVQDNLDKPYRALEYGTKYTPAGIEYIPVVLTIDKQRAQRLNMMFGFQDVDDTQKKPELRQRFEQESKSHQDAEVFQYEVLQEVEAQMSAQFDLLKERHYIQKAIDQYTEVLDMVRSLLETRKNLSSVSSEVGRPEVSSVYRLGDPNFIRRVPEITRASVERPQRSF